MSAFDIVMYVFGGLLGCFIAALLWIDFSKKDGGW